MKRVWQSAVVLWMCGCLGLVLPLVGAARAGEKTGAEEDKTLSPYFFVQSDNPGIDALPLKSTRADVTLSGVIADVQVMQVYKNEGKSTLEAIYVFPASSRAAVYAMRMTIGERTIEAKIQEREQARQTYAQALSEGKSAALLEQQRPNVFQMNVGNILPGDEIKVVMNYTELLVPEDGTYEFVYPTVVGPRYSNKDEATAGSQDKWVANPYLEEGKDSPFTFAFDLTLNSGLPIAKITSPSHDLDIAYTGKTSAHIGLKESNKTNNRDVVIQYSLAGSQIESGLLLNIGKQEDFFLLMLEPPKRVANSMIVPREYVFIVDVSGSMSGFPLEVSKSLLKDLLGHLRSTDFFNVLLFSGGSSTLSEKSLPATQENLQKAIDLIDHQQGGGGTELMPALQSAMALPRPEANLSRSMVIVTDGYVDVEKDAFDYVRKHLHQGNVFAFGIGSSVNRFLMEGLARAGMGEPFIVLNEQDAAAKAKKFREYIESPVLTDIRVNFNGLKTSEVEPEAIPDLFAQKPVVIFGKYHGTPTGTIIITGKTAGQPYSQEIRVSEGEISTKNTALRYLWARHRIIELADMIKLAADDAQVKEVTRLGLEYNLLTDYTSFVAVDTLKRTDGKPQNTVKQPLPLPQGVSNLAVGQASTAVNAAIGVNCKAAMGSVSYHSGRTKSLEYCEDEAEAPAPMQALPAEKMKAEPKKDAMDYKRKVAACRIKVEKITGSLDAAQVEKALDQQRAYLLHVMAKESLTGEYEIEMTLDAQGNITKLDFTKDTFNSSDLKANIEALLKRIQFTTTGDGKEAKIILSLKSGQ